MLLAQRQDGMQRRRRRSHSRRRRCRRLIATAAGQRQRHGQREDLDGIWLSSALLLCSVSLRLPFDLQLIQSIDSSTVTIECKSITKSLSQGNNFVNKRQPRVEPNPPPIRAPSPEHRTPNRERSECNPRIEMKMEMETETG